MNLGLAEDLTGQKFSNWTALYRCERPKGIKSGTYWMCSCDCGDSTRAILAKCLKTGKVADCDCLVRQRFVGTHFGDWTVVDVIWKYRPEVARRPPLDFQRDRWAVCVCKCGTQKDVVLASLVIGDSNGCGCSRGYDDPRHAPVTKIICTYKREASDAGRVWELDRKLVDCLLASNCYYCGIPPSNTLRSRNDYVFMYSGIDRIDNAEGYIPINVVPCCKVCNMAKRTADRQIFLGTVKKIYEHLKLENAVFNVVETPTSPTNFVSDNRPRWNRKRRQEGQARRRTEKENNLQKVA